MPRRVIIADDHPVFLLGLRTILATLPENYQIVGKPMMLLHFSLCWRKKKRIC